MRSELKAAIVGAVASSITVGVAVGLLQEKPVQPVLVPPSVVKPTYDPGLYTPFTRAPRPPHPPEVYYPPGHAASPAGSPATR